jgi:malate permease and related proteins
VSAIIATLGVYFFVALGFAAKRKFRELDERTLILLSVYFLQPILSFWGILGKSIELSDLYAPLGYFAISLIGAILGWFIFVTVLKDKKAAAIATAGGIIGNTGNLGIPLLVALYGKSVAFYAVLINLANVVILYTVGVFLYSLGSCDTKTALKNIAKMPVLWSATVAMALNIAGVSFHPAFMQTIEMGAYASMVLQLLIFGIFIGGLGKLSVDIKTLVATMTSKFILLPLLAFALLSLVNMPPLIKTLVFLQVCMPLAVSNVILASLYECKPYTVTANILASFVLFLGLFFVYRGLF